MPTFSAHSAASAEQAQLGRILAVTSKYGAHTTRTCPGYLSRMLRAARIGASQFELVGLHSTTIVVGASPGPYDGRPRRSSGGVASGGSRRGLVELLVGRAGLDDDVACRLGRGSSNASASVPRCGAAIEQVLGEQLGRLVLVLEVGHAERGRAASTAAAR